MGDDTDPRSLELRFPRWGLWMWRVIIGFVYLVILAFSVAMSAPWWQELLLWIPILVGIYTFARGNVARWDVRPGELFVVGIFSETTVPASRVTSVEYFKTNDSVKVYGKPPLRWEMPFSGSAIVPERFRRAHRARVQEIEKVLMDGRSYGQPDDGKAISRRWARPRKRDIALMLLVVLPALPAVAT